MADRSAEGRPERSAPFVKVSCRMPDHYKMARLAQLIGVSRNEAVGAMVRLWGWLPEHRSLGRLTGMTAEDIAVVMDLTVGEPKTLVEALVEVRLLDRAGDEVVVHDWTAEPHTGAYYMMQAAKATHGPHVRDGRRVDDCAWCVEHFTLHVELHADCGWCRRDGVSVPERDVLERDVLDPRPKTQDPEPVRTSKGRAFVGVDPPLGSGPGPPVYRPEDPERPF